MFWYKTIKTTIGLTMTAYADRITSLKRNQIQQINSYLDGAGRAKFDSNQLRFVKYFEESDVLELGSCCQLIRGFFIRDTNYHNHDIYGVHYDLLLNERLVNYDPSDYREDDYQMEVNEIKLQISKTVVSHILTLKTSRDRSSEFLLLNHYYYPIGLQRLDF